MSRAPRIEIPGIPLHIVQRGNNRAACFFSDIDRRFYLKCLAETARRRGCAIHAYALMTNHVHLMGLPHDEESLAKTIGSIHLRYTLLLNTREGWQGHLWQNRYFSAPLDEAYRWRALRYIELNPVRAGMVAVPEEYHWSSAAAHLGVYAPPPWLDMSEWADCWTPDTWRDYLNEREGSETDLVTIRSRTSLGRPLGSSTFIQEVEQQTGRRLQYGPAGRPKKPPESSEADKNGGRR